MAIPLNMRALFASLLAALALALPGHRAQAATRTWDGGGANALWDTVNNWDNNGLPASGDTLEFGSGFSSGTTIDLNGNRTVNKVIINTTTGFSITNSTLTLSSGDITRTDVAGTEANHIISSAIALGADGAWNIAGSGSLTLSGIISGARKATKSGAGTLILSGANTFSGEFSITAGTLGLGHNSATGTGNLKIGAATIYADGAARTIGTTVTLDQNFTIGGSQDLTFTGAASLGRDITITTDNTGSSTFSGVISGGHKLTKAGAGTLVLSGANTFSHEMTLTAGTLALGHNSAAGTDIFIINGGTVQAYGTARTIANDLTLGGNFTIGGSLDLTFTGDAALSANRVITVDNTGNSTFSGVISGSATLTKNGAGTLILTGVNTYVGANTINGGTVAINSASSLGNASNTVTLNAATLEVTSTFTTTRSFTLGNAASTIQVDPSQTFTVNTAIAGSGALNKSGTGTLVLGAANTYSGTTNVSAGTLRISASERIANAGALTVSGGTLDVQTFTETVGAVTLTSGSITGTGAGTLSGTSYAVESGSVSAILSGSGAMTKTTAGAVTLTGANTFTGATTISGGTLLANADSALGATSKVTVNTGGTLLLGVSTAGSNRIGNAVEVELAGGGFETGGFSETVGKLTLTSNSVLNFGSGASLLTFDGIGSSLGSSTLTILNWSGVIGSAGGTDRLLFDNSSFVGGTSSNQLIFDIGGTYYTADFKTVDGNTVEAVAGMAVVPEPSTIFAVSLLGMLIGWRERHRLGALLSRLARG